MNDLSDTIETGNALITYLLQERHFGSNELRRLRRAHQHALERLDSSRYVDAAPRGLDDFMVRLP